MKKSSQNNTGILHISNIGPRDEGNYLSNFDNESPNFKAILEINRNNSSETFTVILLLCGLIFFCNCSFFKTLNKNDDSDRTRTCNPLIRSQMLYPLSYRVKFNKYCWHVVFMLKLETVFMLKLETIIPILFLLTQTLDIDIILVCINWNRNILFLNNYFCISENRTAESFEQDELELLHHLLPCSTSCFSNQLLLLQYRV